MNYYCKNLLNWNDILTRVECIYPGVDPVYKSINLERLISFGMSRVNDLGYLSFEHFSGLDYYMKVHIKPSQKNRQNNSIIFRAFNKTKNYVSMAHVIQTIRVKSIKFRKQFETGLKKKGIRYSIDDADRFVITPDTVSQLITVNSLITKYIEQ